MNPRTRTRLSMASLQRVCSRVLRAFSHPSTEAAVDGLCLIYKAMLIRVMPSRGWVPGWLHDRVDVLLRQGGDSVLRGGCVTLRFIPALGRCLIHSDARRGMAIGI